MIEPLGTRVAERVGHTSNPRIAEAQPPIDKSSQQTVEATKWTWCHGLPLLDELTPQLQEHVGRIGFNPRYRQATVGEQQACKDPR